MKNNIYDLEKICRLETDIEKAIENNDPKLAQLLIAKKERLENRGNRTKVSRKRDISDDEL